MKNLVSFLDALKEMEEETAILRKLGLTEEEIQGYFEFYMERYIAEPKNEEAN